MKNLSESACQEEKEEETLKSPRCGLLCDQRGPIDCDTSFITPDALEQRYHDTAAAHAAVPRLSSSRYLNVTDHRLQLDFFTLAFRAQWSTPEEKHLHQQRNKEANAESPELQQRGVHRSFVLHNETLRNIGGQIM